MKAYRNQVRWAIAILITPAIALNWWEWQWVLKLLTSADYVSQWGWGCICAMVNVAAVTFIAFDRGWFKQEEKK